MSYLDKLNRFSMNPVNIDIKRSTFSRPFEHKTTFTSGKLIPIMVDEVLPGDTFKVDFASVVRSITPAVPVMDNSFLDLYFFFVPARLCTAHEKDFQKVFGENNSTYWTQSSEATLESTGNTYSMESDILYNSIGAYMGLPQGSWSNIHSNVLKINNMPLNGYKLIFNEWFRDQNVQAPVTYLSYDDECLFVNKIHDYFTSALPSPQKGDSVFLPLGDYAPVITRSKSAMPQSFPEVSKPNTYLPLNWVKTDTTKPGGDPHYLIMSGTTRATHYEDDEYTYGTDGGSIVPQNLWADLSNASSINVNTLRQAFAIQKLLEKDARGGTRYREMLKAHFGVSIPDATVQVPEYLAGHRFPLNITQVLQTSETGSNAPLGTTGAFSNTFMNDRGFVKSFTEYGYLYALVCVRTSQSYSQGVPKMFLRNRRYDFYHPVFANLGEQAIKAIELYYGKADGSNITLSSDVFGYQEAWAEYRYKPNLVSGLLAPNSGDVILSSWTYTNNFSSKPVLNADFMYQSDSQIGKTLVVSDANYQFIGDFYFDIKCTRPMPLYSIPGLIDHH